MTAQPDQTTAPRMLSIRFRDTMLPMGPNLSGTTIQMDQPDPRFEGWRFSIVGSVLYITTPPGYKRDINRPMWNPKGPRVTWTVPWIEATIQWEGDVAEVEKLVARYAAKPCERKQSGGEA